MTRRYEPRHRTAIAPLPPDARLAFDAMRRITSRDRMAALLHVSEFTIQALEYDGKARPDVVAKISRALGCAP